MNLMHEGVRKYKDRTDGKLLVPRPLKVTVDFSETKHCVKCGVNMWNTLRMGLLILLRAVSKLCPFKRDLTPAEQTYFNPAHSGTPVFNGIICKHLESGVKTGTRLK